jgi:LAO/AO transport system kinase
VLLLQPETGDDLQWEKAGLFEVADVIVIHKADLPGAERVEAQVLAALGLAMGPPVPVLRVSARTGAGLPELWQAIAARPLKRDARHEGRDLLRLAQETLAARFMARADDTRLSEVLLRWQRGELDTLKAGAAVLEILGPSDGAVAR